MIVKRFHKNMFGRALHQHLLRVPRQYANEHSPTYDRDAALIMGRSSARSPENVQALLKAYQVERVEELLELLPDQRHQLHPLRRLRAMLRRMAGASPYNPDLSRERRLKALGYFSRPEIHERIAQVKQYQHQDERR